MTDKTIEEAVDFSKTLLTLSPGVLANGISLQSAHELARALLATTRENERLKAEIESHFADGIRFTKQLAAQALAMDGLRKQIEWVKNRFYPLKITHPNEVAVIETSHAIDRALSNPNNAGEKAVEALRFYSNEKFYFSCHCCRSSAGGFPIQNDKGQVAREALKGLGVE